MPIFLFFVFYMIDIILLNRDDFNSNTNITCIIFRVFALLLALFPHCYFENKQMKFQGFSRYLKDWWNISDILLVLAYIAYFIISLCKQNNRFSIEILFLQCVIVLIYAANCSNSLRMFKNIGFLVSMVFKILYEMRFFFIYYVLLMSFLSIQISIALNGVPGYYDISDFKWFIISL